MVSGQFMNYLLGGLLAGLGIALIFMINPGTTERWVVPLIFISCGSVLLIHGYLARKCALGGNTIQNFKCTTWLPKMA
jgi:hypothetical protein